MNRFQPVIAGKAYYHGRDPWGGQGDMSPLLIGSIIAHELFPFYFFLVLYLTVCIQSDQFYCKYSFIFR